MTDYIIVGGGPAGCVLANRLSEDPAISVLLLEAGGSDWHPLIHMPAGFAKMTKGIASWGWSTVPQKHMKDRVFRYTQAKVIGGGSSINAQIYTRGNAARLRRLGEGGGPAPAGAIATCCPTSSAPRTTALRQRLSRLRRAARRLQSDRAAADLRGLFPAGQELGIPFNPDFNGAQPGRRRLLPAHAEKRPPLVGLRRLSEADPRPQEPDGPHRRHGHARRGREGQGDRRRDRRRSPAASRKSCAPSAKSSSPPAPSARQSC